MITMVMLICVFSPFGIYTTISSRTEAQSLPIHYSSSLIVLHRTISAAPEQSLEDLDPPDHPIAALPPTHSPARGRIYTKEPLTGWPGPPSGPSGPPPRASSQRRAGWPQLGPYWITGRPGSPRDCRPGRRTAAVGTQRRSSTGRAWPSPGGSRARLANPERRWSPRLGARAGPSRDGARSATRDQPWRWP